MIMCSIAGRGGVPCKAVDAPVWDLLPQHVYRIHLRLILLHRQIAHHPISQVRGGRQFINRRLLAFLSH